MKEQLLRQLHSVKTMSIVGMCKNAGKTTMLNWLLEQGRLQGVLGLTSIGRDGESTDVVTGTEKPGIFVREGTLIATAQDMLRLGDITKEILMTTGIPTPLGEVVIVRARSAGHVQLAGPSITTQLKAVSQYFFDLGADRSVIDGALGRKSLGARAVAEGVILCTGASYHMSMDKVIADTAHIYRLMNLPKAETLPPEAAEGLEKCWRDNGAAFITGALTDSMVLPLLRSGALRSCRLVVKDPSKVLLSADTLDKLVTREVALETEDAARTLCVTVNPVSHRPRTQTFAPQCAVDDGLLRAQREKALRHRPQLRGDGRPRQLHISGAAGAKDHHLAQRRGDTGGHEDLLGHVAQPQHVLGGGDQGALPDENARLLRTGDHIGGLAVPPDGGQPQRPPQMAAGQQPVEHGGLARVLAHAHDGHGLCLVEPAYQLLVHGIHALSLWAPPHNACCGALRKSLLPHYAVLPLFSQFLSIAYRIGKRNPLLLFVHFSPCLFPALWYTDGRILRKEGHFCGKAVPQ